MSIGLNKQSARPLPDTAPLSSGRRWHGKIIDVKGLGEVTGTLVLDTVWQAAGMKGDHWSSAG